MHPAWISMCVEANGWIDETGLGKRIISGCHPLCTKQLSISREFQAENLARAQLAEYICQVFNVLFFNRLHRQIILQALASQLIFI